MLMKTEIEEVFYMNPLEVKVKDGLERFRKDLGDLKDLGKSLRETGQIQPVVINRKQELIVGGRRTAACIMEGLKVKVIYEDMVDPIKMRLYELEENLHRKDLTPAEYALATEELHRLMQKEHGKSVSGKKGGHSLEATAKMLGKTRGTVIAELERAEMVKLFPELKQTTKKSEFTKAAKGLQKLQVTMSSLEDYEKILKEKTDLFQLYNIDTVEYMRSLPDNSVDILLTDPPFGFDVDKLAKEIGGKTGGLLSSSGYKLTDETELTMELLKELAIESFRFTTSQAHGFVFCAPEHFWTLRQIFMHAGWKVYVKPMIWIKRPVGQCNLPAIWPSSCYEMLLYIRKDNSRLVKEGRADWLQYDPIVADKFHPFQKPIPLLIDLLERISLPGQRLSDPFMGSGSSIIAGLKMKLLCEGCDNSLEAYATATRLISNYLKEEKGVTND